MSADVDAILARARKSIEEIKRLSAMAERLAHEARKVRDSLEPPQAKVDRQPSADQGPNIDNGLPTPQASQATPPPQQVSN